MYSFSSDNINVPDHDCGSKVGKCENDPAGDPSSVAVLHVDSSSLPTKARGASGHQCDAWERQAEGSCAEWHLSSVLSHASEFGSQEAPARLPWAPLLPLSRPRIPQSGPPPLLMHAQPDSVSIPLPSLSLSQLDPNGAAHNLARRAGL